MKSSTFFGKVLTGVAASAVALMMGGASYAQEVTLTLHHFLGTKSPTHKDFLAPWAERIATASDGRIKVEIFPSMSMGGKPGDLYGQARDGVADITWTLTGYTPGVFPRSEVFELPFVHENSAAVTNLAIAEIFDEHLADDFTGIKPLLIHVHGGQAVFTVNRPIRTPADFNGLKLRTPSRTGAWMIEAMGAKPVGMPVPALPQALSKGVVDGAFIPFEMAVPLKTHQMTNYATEGENGVRFGTAVFMLAMNQERFDSLPVDLQKIINDNSGINIAKEIGDVWDANEPIGKEITAATGSEMIVLTEAEIDVFREKLSPVTARWVEEVGENGIDGSAILTAARAAIEKHSK